MCELYSKDKPVIKDMDQRKALKQSNLGNLQEENLSQKPIFSEKKKKAKLMP